MTALKQYARLETTGVWRPSPSQQRREVFVSLGEATLTISDQAGRALSHWSLAAIHKARASESATLYHPNGDDSETLELKEDASDLVAALDRLLLAIERQRPHPGKLRFFLATLSAAAVFTGLVWWLPGALTDYATSVVPPVKRAEIGRALQTHITRVAGQPCQAASAMRPLERLATRVLGPTASHSLVVLPEVAGLTRHLPGGVLLLDRSIIEDFEDADVPAGYILAESLHAQTNDPLRALLMDAGLGGTLRFLTTGRLSEDVLATHAETLLSTPKPTGDTDALLVQFAQAGLRSTPYAYAQDVTGETTLRLIEADPMVGHAGPEVLSDADWVRLQGICGA